MGEGGGFSCHVLASFTCHNVAFHLSGVGILRPGTMLSKEQHITAREGKTSADIVTKWFLVVLGETKTRQEEVVYICLGSTLNISSRLLLKTGAHHFPF